MTTPIIYTMQGNLGGSTKLIIWNLPAGVTFDAIGQYSGYQGQLTNVSLYSVSSGGAVVYAAPPNGPASGDLLVCS